MHDVRFPEFVHYFSCYSSWFYQDTIAQLLPTSYGYCIFCSPEVPVSCVVIRQSCVLPWWPHPSVIAQPHIVASIRQYVTCNHKNQFTSVRHEHYKQCSPIIRLLLNDSNEIALRQIMRLKISTYCCHMNNISNKITWIKTESNHLGILNSIWITFIRTDRSGIKIVLTCVYLIV